MKIFCSITRLSLIRSSILLVVALHSLCIQHVTASSPGFVVLWGGQGDTYGATDVPRDLTNVVSVDARSFYTLVLLADGTLRHWGSNGSPPPSGLNNVAAISQPLALLSNGTVIAWGPNEYVTDMPPGLSGIKAIAAGNYHALALKENGTVIGWGGNGDSWIVPAGLSDVVQIAAGQSHSLALKRDGTVVAWGNNSQGQTSTPPGLSNVVQIAGGGYHSVALTTKGTVVVWGGQQDNPLQPPPDLSGVVAISAGTWHNVAVKSDGTVVSWGDNSRGQASVPASLRGVSIIAAGHMHSIAVSTSAVPIIRTQPQNTVANGGATVNLSVDAVGAGPLSYQWYKDGTLLLGATGTALILSNIDPTNAGIYTVTVSTSGGSVTSAPAALTVAGLTTGGALVSLAGAEIPGGVTDVVAVDSCLTHSLALKADGTLIGWGGPLARSEAEVLPGLTNVIDFAVEHGFSLAVRPDGTVVQWGTTQPHPMPSDLSNVVAVAAGYFFAVAIKNDGSLVKWGTTGLRLPSSNAKFVAVDAGFNSILALDNFGVAYSLSPLGLNPVHSNITAISLGRTYGLALSADGTVPGVSELSNVVAIAASGDSHSLSLKRDGTVVDWGGPPLNVRLTNVTYISANGNPMVITRWPAITASPQSATVQRGETVTLDATVQGAGPFTFKWRKNGMDSPGATGRTLVLSNVQEEDAATYTLEVGNFAGAIESFPATITLYGVPTIATQPQSHTVFAGAKVSFAVTVTGADPLRYQWYRDGVAVAGAINPELVFTSAAADNAGVYTCIINNEFGQVTSSPATLTLTAAPSWQASAPGTVVALGGPAVPPGLTNIIAVAAGRSHALALRADRTVTSWGRSYADQIPMPPDLSNVVAISAGERHNLALRADGTVVGWGMTPMAGVPDNLYGVVAIAAGFLRQNVAVKSDGRLFAWGGGTTPPTSAVDVTAIDAGWEQGIALRQNGTAVMWNQVGYGDLATSNITAVSMGHRYVLLLKSDGTVEGGGVPENLSNVVSIAAGGDSFGLALKNDGTVVGWGGPPVPEGASGVSAVAAGWFGLLISTNPPPPVLAGSANGDGTISLFSPVSVSGYVLEAAPSVAQPLGEVVPGYTNSFSFSEEENPGFKVPAAGSQGFYRLRKQ